MNKILLALLAFLAYASAVFPQNDADPEIAMLDMMYMCPYNFTGTADLFMKNNVNEITVDYGRLSIVMKIDNAGHRLSTDIEKIAAFTYRYYDDNRVSDADMVIKGMDSVRAAWLFVYGSPTADYDAVFMIKNNPDSEQKAAFFCDDKGTVQRISLTVQKKEMLKCAFTYDNGHVVKIKYEEVAPVGYDTLSLNIVYTYRPDGLIEKEVITSPDGYSMTAYYSYK
ncbi:MAG: hypothetical protein LWX07_10695 [Bacteroidetes bacterium]|nr:hypothetical protein [Bacteroidota bacterium]